MDEDVFNIQLRKFLKKVGIQSQREIERAVREGIASESIDGTESLKAAVVLRVRVTEQKPQLDLHPRKALAPMHQKRTLCRPAGGRDRGREEKEAGRKRGE